MAKKKKSKKPIEQYDHKGKERVNNPPVGLVDAQTDKDTGKKTYAYDPHLDPQLVWAGKAEHTSFDVPTVSLHVHERIDPRTIIEAVRKQNGMAVQGSLFSTPEENPPLREAIEFYKHKHNWSNRLIAGDSLLVMNSLLEKEGMAGQVQMVYIDPPYGIKYGSNFQPFVNKRDVKDGKDEDLTAEPEMIKAFRDTWELGIHSYLSYLRDRLLLAKDLLHESGSVFVQISDENLHHVREIMDEVFEERNFVAVITIQKTSSKSSKQLDVISDYLVFYARDKKQLKYRQLYLNKLESDTLKRYNYLEQPNGESIKLTKRQIEGFDPIPEGKRWGDYALHSQGESSGETSEPFTFEGVQYRPKRGRHWSTPPSRLSILEKKGRIVKFGSELRYKRYAEDFPVYPINNIWTGTAIGTETIFVVQTALSVIQRCILMTTDPGDLIVDPTCGSGTTAYVAERWGRRWLTCDTSRVAVTLAKRRIMTALYDYYKLAHPDEGVGSGFNYKRVQHLTLRSIAYEEPPDEVTLFDCPENDTTKARVTGPFTVEAVPSPTVKPLVEMPEKGDIADASIARSGETLRQTEWKDELLRTGVRGKGGQRIAFTRLETLPGTRWLHADGETKDDKPQRAVVSFGPQHAPLEQRQVELAIEEARTLVPKPTIVVFAAFQFDPEAAKDIDETDWPGVTLLKVQMNADLLTEDLKKKRTSNESFWLMGQPDVSVTMINEGDDEGKYKVEVHGFDYYNTRTGTVDSGGPGKIAMWMLDTDYDGRSLYPRQVFFPMAGEKDGWARLAKNLKAEIDEELIEAYRGTVSLPFETGEHKRIAVKIVDDRGIESLKIIEVE